MTDDFERMSLKELFTDVTAFLAFSVGLIGGLIVLMLVIIWG